MHQLESNHKLHLVKLDKVWHLNQRLDCQEQVHDLLDADHLELRQWDHEPVVHEPQLLSQQPVLKQTILTVYLHRNQNQHYKSSSNLGLAHLRKLTNPN